MFKRLRSLFAHMSRPPLVVVAGPTASGKSSLAVELGLELSRAGKSIEIISADSRQVYREIPIFSGAIAAEEQEHIVHHLLGTESVAEARTAGWFRQEAGRLVRDIYQRGAIPVLVGGSGFWIQGVICDEEYPEVEPNPALRAKLESYTTAQLQAELNRLDPRRSKEVDPHNRRRLIRSIEIATQLGEVPPMQHQLKSEWDLQVIYCNYPKEVNDERIRDNVISRIEAGMIEEAKQVRDKVSPERFEELGLAYKHLEEYWDNKIDKDELVERIVREEVQYAKRQRTFFDKMFSRLPTKVYTISKRSERSKALEWILGHYLHS